MKEHKVDVCIAGGGPAGMVLALLLAHRGVKVLVLEQHTDFSREYRGEVLMPRFLQMFRGLHLDKWLLELPHLKLKMGEIFFKGHVIGRFDFTRTAPDVPYALWLPQTTLLNGLHSLASGYSSYEIWFGTHVKQLIGQDPVEGVVVNRNGEEVHVKAKVTIGADGRYSTILKDGKFQLEYEDYKFDILWFTIPKPKDYDNTFRVLLSSKRSVLILPKYPDSIQAGILVEPGDLQKVRSAGIQKLREELKAVSPLFHEFADQIKDFTFFHPLQARLHMVKEWAKNGCLLIGDSAHCCSPAGAIGVSVAVGTAIVAADVILQALPTDKPYLEKRILDEVQERRQDEVKMIHRIQQTLTGGIAGNVLPIRWLLPFMVSVVARTPFFRIIQRRLMTLREPIQTKTPLAFSQSETRP